jgi:hypothetical protein
VLVRVAVGHRDARGEPFKLSAATADHHWTPPRHAEVIGGATWKPVSAQKSKRRVAETLDTLGQYGWTALHDVHWPGRPLANLDHVAIGPGGVVIIDAKNWTGDVTLTEGVLRQNGYRRDRELEAVTDATAAVTALVAPEHRSAVAGMICLASQDQSATLTTPGVRVVGRLQLASHLVGLPAKLSPYDVADLGRMLGGALGAKTSPTLLTTAALHKPPSKRQS